jgi:hypothetical protein
MKISGKVHLEPNDAGTQVLSMNVLDESDNGVNCRQLDEMWMTPVPLLRNPLINTIGRKSTIGNNAMHKTEKLGDRTKRCDGHQERKMLRVQRANQAPMSQHSGDVVMNIIQKLESQRVVPSGTLRGRGTDDPDVPPINQPINDQNQIPVVLKKIGPGGQV